MSVTSAAIAASALGVAGASTASVGLVLGTTTTRFLLFKSVPGHGQIFEEVSNSEVQLGDILLFPLDRSNNIIVQMIFKHAAIYCGDGEVIHFMGITTQTKHDVISSQKTDGVIIKEGLRKMRKERGKYKIYRKKDGVDCNYFEKKVREAMNSKAEYCASMNNCIHFALSLLGLEEFSSELVQVQDEGDSSHSEATFTFRLYKRIHECGDIFEEVPESKLQPGGIVLFLLESSSEELSNIFKHAAVYCGDGEIIQFQGTQSSGNWSSSGPAPTLITKEGLETMKKKWGKCKIYQKTDGVDLKDFRNKVREAMNNDAAYDFLKNNCIRFALSLLGLEEFYSQLVEIQDEGGSSDSGGAGQGSSHTA